MVSFIKYFTTEIIVVEVIPDTNPFNITFASDSSIVMRINQKDTGEMEALQNYIFNAFGKDLIIDEIGESGTTTVYDLV